MILAIELDGTERPVGTADGRAVDRVSNIRGVSIAQPLDRFARDRPCLFEPPAIAQQIGQLVKRLAIPEAIPEHLRMLARELRVMREPLSIESLGFPGRF